jgi:hypothetical protein
MQNVNLKQYCFFKVIVVDGDLSWCFDDDYDDDFNDDDLLMMTNSYMRKWRWYWRWPHVWKVTMLMMMICWVNVCIIEWYVHAFISRIFISNDDDYDTLYPTTMIRILCIQRRWLWYSCIKWWWLVPHPYRVVSIGITYIW